MWVARRYPKSFHESAEVSINASRELQSTSMVASATVMRAVGKKHDNQSEGE
jgi:hypothetical protein